MNLYCNWTQRFHLDQRLMRSSHLGAYECSGTAWCLRARRSNRQYGKCYIRRFGGILVRCREAVNERSARRDGSLVDLPQLAIAQVDTEDVTL